MYKRKRRSTVKQIVEFNKDEFVPKEIGYKSTNRVKVPWFLEVV